MSDTSSTDYENNPFLLFTDPVGYYWWNLQQNWW